MRVVLIDDDSLVSMSLKMIIETDPDIKIVATGSDGDEALSLYKTHTPDVLLMDVRMQRMNGTEALAQIIKEFPHAKVLFLTTFVDDEYIVKALQLGAKGYILKQNYEHIIPALKAVASGQNVFGNEIISKIPELMKSTESFDYSTFGITEKEFEIIEKVADGLSNKEIADVLFLSEGTVRNYLSEILDKLSLRDRTQLAIFYYQHK